jgi:hypothetical protein
VVVVVVVVVLLLPVVVVVMAKDVRLQSSRLPYQVAVVLAAVATPLATSLVSKTQISAPAVQPQGQLSLSLVPPSDHKVYPVLTPLCPRT